MSRIIKLCHYDSPIGRLSIGCSDSCVQEIFFEDSKGWRKRSKRVLNLIKVEYLVETTKLHLQVIQQLEEYFLGKRSSFNLPLDAIGTTYQSIVWTQLHKIPYARTISYLLLAQAIGSKNHCRAVANANSKNPISIIIPCHRVIQNDGTLGGYAGELWRKEWLLKHENQYKQHTT